MSMNRNEFMTELKKRLNKLPYDEIKEAVDYYEEYFDDAGKENEQNVIAELGTPAGIASQIIADYAVKGADKKKAINVGLSTVWLVIIAVFASPVALPLGLAVVIIALAIVIVILSVIISIGASGLGMTLGGLAYAILSIFLFGKDFATALFTMGCGLLVCGIGVLLLIATVSLSGNSFNRLAKWIGELILRRKTK